MSRPFGECAPGYPIDEPDDSLPPTPQELVERFDALRQEMIELGTHLGQLVGNAANTVTQAPSTALALPPEEAGNASRLYSRVDHIIEYGRLDPNTQAKRIAFLRETAVKLQPTYDMLYQRLLTEDHMDKRENLPPYPVSTDLEYTQKQAAYVAAHARTHKWSEQPVDSSAHYDLSLNYLPGAGLAVTGFGVKTTAQEHFGVELKPRKIDLSISLAFDQGVITRITYQKNVAKRMMERRKYGDSSFDLDLTAMQLQHQHPSSDLLTFDFSEDSERFVVYNKSSFTLQEVNSMIDTALRIIPTSDPTA